MDNKEYFHELHSVNEIKFNCNKCNKELTNNIKGSIIFLNNVIWKGNNTFLPDYDKSGMSYVLCEKCTQDVIKNIEEKFIKDY